MMPHDDATPSVPTDGTRNPTPPVPPPPSPGTLSDRHLPPPSSETVYPTSTASSAAPTLRVGDYEVLEELGRGGMGVVYRARHRTLGHEVALKMILAGVHAGPEERARFLLEAGAVARLHHPSIVQIHDFGEHDGNPFFSLEFLTGGSLAQRLKQGRLPPREAAALVKKLARAMQHAHDKGIVHRDLKPANVLLNAEGEPKVADFGLAKQIDGAGPSVTGNILGTPAYMAPEQARGDIHATGPATDVYALGAILYECLTGRPPFQGATLHEMLVQVVVDPPVTPRKVVPTLSRDLETVCLRCLEKDPGKRYLSATDLADDLGRFQRGEPVAARPVGVVERAARWARRRPAVAGLLAILVALTGVGLGLVFWQWREAVGAHSRAEEKAQEADAARRAEARRADEANRARQETLTAIENTRKALRGAQLRLADSLLAQGNVLAAGKRWGPAKTLFIQARGLYTELGASPLVAHLEYALAEAESPDSLMTLTGHGGAVLCVALSPDGQRAVSGSSTGEVKVWDLATGCEPSPAPAHAAAVVGVSFSSDGRRVLSGGADGTVRVHNLASRQVRCEFRTRPSALRAVAFLPDGKQVLCAAQEPLAEPDKVDGRVGKETPSTVLLCDADTGKVQGRLRVQGMIWSLAVSPDGRSALAGSADRTLHLGLKPLRVLRSLVGATATPGHSLLQWWRVNAVAFSSSGKAAVAGCSDSVFEVWNLEDGKQINAVAEHCGGVRGVAFVPGEEFAILSARGDGTARLDAEAGPRRFYGHSEGISALSVAEDGGRFLTGSLDGTLRLWRTRPPVLLPNKLTGAGLAPQVRFSPDGRLLLSLDTAFREVKLWDAAAGRLLTAPRFSEEVTAAVFGSEVGQLLVADTSGRVTCWDVRRRAVRAYHGLDAEATALTVSPGGVIAAGGKDGTIILWDGASGAVLRTLRGPAAGVTHVALSTDGSLLVAAGADGTLTAWGRQLEAPRWSVAAPGVEALALSPAGDLVATGHTDATARLRDAADGAPRQIFRGHQNTVTGVAFSPDGRFLLTGGFDGHIKAWQADTGAEAASWGEMPVTSLAVAADGHIAAGVMGDHKLHGGADIVLWDCSKVEPALDLTGQLGRVRAALAARPDDAEALATLGRWYAVRGEWASAVDLLSRARIGGAAGVASTAADCWLRLGDPAAAAEDLRVARQEARDEAERFYQQLRLESLGRSPALLLDASGKGDLKLVTFMIRQGADLTAEDEDGNTPLHLAATGGHLDVVRILADAGARVDALNHLQETPLFPAVQHVHVPVAKYLIERGADVRRCNAEGRTPLHLAAFRGNQDLITLLIGRGAGVAATDNDGQTPLDHARKGAGVYKEVSPEHWRKVFDQLTPNEAPRRPK